MKKDRNTFFQGSEYSATTYIPPMNQILQNNMMPYNQMPVPFTEAQQSYYAGVTPNYQQIPNQNMNYNTNYNNNNIYTDLENRIAKLEREVNRLNNRLLKLESKNDNTSTDYSNSMYMV